MKKTIKRMAYLLSFILMIAPLLSGCGIFNPPAKDKDGYFIKHLTCCGPTAVEAAINEYYKQHKIAFIKNPAPREEVSKKMQDDGQVLKTLLSLLDREAVCVTWSWELKAVVQKYGFKLIKINEFEKLDPLKDIALVLVRGKFVSTQWHWMCFPVDKNITDFFGENTKIDTILLLKKD